MEQLRAWWPLIIQIALFLTAGGAFVAKVDGYEESFRRAILELQGRILETNSSQDERMQLSIAETTRRLDEMQGRVNRLENPFFNRKDTGLNVRYADLLVVDPEIRPLIYNKEIDQLERDIMILQTLLGAEGISKPMYDKLNDKLWEKQSEKQDLLLKQQVCEFDDQRR